MDPAAMPTLGGDDSARVPRPGQSWLHHVDAAHPGVSRTYSTTQLGTHLSQGFRDLWEEKLLFDCTIVVDSQSFQLHKGLLIAMSPYFRSMFTSGFEEAGKSQVELKGVTPGGFSAVVTFLYTSEICLNEGCIQDVMEAAAHLQIPCVLDFCASFMLEVLTTTHCFEYLKLVDMYGHLQAQDGILDFIAKSCRLVKEKEDFWNLPYQFFLKILRNDDLEVTSEADVLRIALSWLSKHTCEPEEADALLGLVRLPLIPEAELQTQLQQIESTELCKQLDDLIQASKSPRPPGPDGDVVISPRATYRRSYCTESGIFVIRHPRDVLETDMCYIMRGHGNGQFSDKVQMDILPRPLENASVVQLDNYVFLTGGNMVGDRMSSDHMYRFDMFTRKWVQMASMCEGRALHASGALHNTMVVVVGGLVVHDPASPRGDYTSSVEVYNLRENKWRRTANFPYKVCNIQACTVLGNMYTCGGTIDVAPRPRVNSYRLHMYDDGADDWIERSSMHAKKQWHVMYALKEKIYVFGGVSSGDAEFMPGFNINFQYANMAEVYDPQTNQWTVLAFPHTMQALQALQRPLGGAFHVGNTLYFVARRRLLMFNPESSVWRLMDYDRGDLGVGDLVTVVKVPADCL